MVAATGGHLGPRIGVVSETAVLDHSHPGVARITLNRPERLNAINNELLTDFTAALDAVDADPDVRCIVLTGAGRGFCAGADLKGSDDVPGTEGFGPVLTTFSYQQRIVAVVTRLRRLRKPVIAAVNGAASGGGFAFVLGSDIRIAAESARFNAAFIKIGISGCDQSVSWLLPRIVGAGNAHLLMLTGRLISAAEAYRMGMLAEVVPDDQLLDTAYSIADEIVANSPFGVWMTKEVMWAALEIPSQQALVDLENRTQVLASLTEDAQEQLDSYLAKREPTYRWR
jgi:enoyl-CoA hydratase